jgi:hypothetical protein
MNGTHNHMSEPAREGLNDRKRERILLPIGLPCTRVNKDERKARDILWSSQPSMESDFA